MYIRKRHSKKQYMCLSTFRRSYLWPQNGSHGHKFCGHGVHFVARAQNGHKMATKWSVVATKFGTIDKGLRGDITTLASSRVRKPACERSIFETDCPGAPRDTTQITTVPRRMTRGMRSINSSSRPAGAVVSTSTTSESREHQEEGIILLYYYKYYYHLQLLLLRTTTCS